MVASILVLCVLLFVLVLVFITTHGRDVKSISFSIDATGVHFDTKYFKR